MNGEGMELSTTLQSAQGGRGTEQGGLALSDPFQHDVNNLLMKTAAAQPFGGCRPTILIDLSNTEHAVVLLRSRTSATSYCRSWLL